MTYAEKIKNMIMSGNKEGARLIQMINNTPLSTKEKYKFGQKECKNISDFEMDLATFIALGE